MATTANHVLLQRITLTADTSSIIFDSIPQTGYTDLKVVCAARGADNIEWLTISINGSTANISGKYLYGSGGGTGSGNISAGGLLSPQTPSSWTANTFSSNEFYIPNYTSNTVKSISVDGVGEYNNTAGDIMLSALLWNSTAAITSFGVQPISGSFAAGSSFSLYGIADVNTTPTAAPKADGGDIIKTDGTYWYHAFTGSGIFKPQVNLTCDYFVAAGGGGGGTSIAYYGAGGGGAGGLRSATSQSFAALTSYTCTIGAGGAAGANGANSSLNSISTTGGGKGGDGNGGAGSSGGSGGGAGSNAAGGSGNAGSYSPVEGYAGGASSANSNGAGGGGAGGAASTASTAGQGTNGGAGLNTWSTWATATGTGVSGYFAGGGGGGSYSGYSVATGSGGGGNGGVASNGVAAVANTGGGGGGAGNSGSAYSGGAGGSGIIIIRYPV